MTGVTVSRPEQNYRIEISHPVFLGGPGHVPAELDLSPDRPDYVTTDGVEVWIERKRQKTRFLDRHGSQVGPVHRNLAPAIVWARAQGWHDPSLPQWFNDAVIAEVSAGGAAVDAGEQAPVISQPAGPAAAGPAPPRLRYGQQCPECLHPWWAHETCLPVRKLASPPPRYCIGKDCRCTRLGPAPRI